ncbi:MAG: hypothetical protein ACO1RA_14950 [Planctomycetaceae bacterium]
MNDKEEINPYAAPNSCPDNSPSSDKLIIRLSQIGLCCNVISLLSMLLYQLFGKTTFVLAPLCLPGLLLSLLSARKTTSNYSTVSFVAGIAALSTLPTFMLPVVGWFRSQF